MIKDIGVLFQPDMVRAIIADNKDVTRRLVSPQPLSKIKPNLYHNGSDRPKWAFWHGRLMNEPRTWPSPYGQAGDRLYVREAWRTIAAYDNDTPKKIENHFNTLQCPPFIEYLATLNKEGVQLDGRYRHARFMPKAFARLWLEVVNVSIEHLQDITPDDCRREGMPKDNTDIGVRHAYGQLWNRINTATPWDANPWVWRVEFKKVSAP